MNKLASRFAILSLLTGFAVFTDANAQEKKLNKEDLPPAVQKTVETQSQGATIRSFSTEVENGKRIYEVQMTVNGRGRDISMDKDGSIVEIEDEVTMESLSQAVRNGLTKAAATGTITRVEALTKNGKLVAYEAGVKNGTKHSEVQVGPDGKKLAHPE